MLVVIVLVFFVLENEQQNNNQYRLNPFKYCNAGAHRRPRAPARDNKTSSRLLHEKTEIREEAFFQAFMIRTAKFGFIFDRIMNKKHVHDQISSTQNQR